MLLLWKFRCQVRLQLINFLECKLLSSNEWIKSCTFHERLLEKLARPHCALLFGWASGDNDWNGHVLYAKPNAIMSVRGYDLLNTGRTVVSLVRS